MRHLRMAAATAAVIAIAVTGCAGRGDAGDPAAGAPTPGVTDTEITFGGTFPYSGAASSYSVVGEAAKAYFAYVNAERGGVAMGDGKTRTINYLTEDDAYEPNRTVEAARKLVEQDQVFGLHNMLGTGTNLAARDYINQRGVPQVLIGGGASNWGADTEEYPWSMGWQIAYTTEAGVWGQYLKQAQPDARVAILFQNDDLGKDYVNGFKQEIEGSGIQIVSELPFNTSDATVDSQVTDLAATQADVFLNISTPKFAAQAIKRKAELGWNAEQFVAAVSSSISTVYTPAGLDNATGVITADFLKNPSDPAYASDPGVSTFKEKLAQYGPGLDPNDRNVLFGWGAAETLYAGLENTQEPTRDSFMESMRNLDVPELDLFVPGIGIKTGPDDGYPVESAQLYRFNGTSNEALGEVISYEGATPVLTED